MCSQVIGWNKNELDEPASQQREALNCLSRMTGNFHVRFLEEEAAERLLTYSTACYARRQTSTCLKVSSPCFWVRKPLFWKFWRVKAISCQQLGWIYNLKQVNNIYCICNGKGFTDNIWILKINCYKKFIYLV